MMVDEINFLPFIGDPMSLPFSVKVTDDEPFRVVISRAIKQLAESNSALLSDSFDISTASADIPLPPEDLDLTVSAIVEKYGSAFSIKRGTGFRIE